ncbi:hypothetical protein B7R74_02100 [Yersinia pseudotuberculosis]|nr:hypothetical protein [Yersinia pseudotuberculosis]MBO1562340.1 hypothetical protein [Yersinia pseudotuberculosis]PSH23671.1 hypothetical protein B7R74_02100 [Yersinia pseudotuberculosis]
MKTTIKPTAKFCLTANNAEGRQNAHDQSRLNQHLKFVAINITAARCRDSQHRRNKYVIF